MIEYGITTSKAQVWVHVCPLDASFYWYNRKQMLDAMTRFPAVEIATARGYLVRLFGVRACDGGFVNEIERPYPWFGAFAWKSAATDDAAGDIGEAMFEKLVSEHGFPYPLNAERYRERAEQYQGKDFRVTPRVAGIDIEIKADFRGGEWGTGNLFVQTHEKRGARGRHMHREEEPV